MSTPERDGEPVDGAPEPSPAPTDGWSAVDRLLGEPASESDDLPTAEERGWPSSPTAEARGWPSSHGVGWPSDEDAQAQDAKAAASADPTASAPVPPAPVGRPTAPPLTSAVPPAGAGVPSGPVPSATGPYAAPPSTPHASPAGHDASPPSPWGPPAPHHPGPNQPGSNQPGPTYAAPPPPGPYGAGPSPAPGGWQQLDGTRWEGLAVAAFVVSLVSMLCLNLLAPVGIVLGAVALQRVAQNGRRGRGLAGWAIGVGVVSSIIGVLFLIGVLADEGLL